MFDKVMDIWHKVQAFLSVDGGLYIDAMCLVILLRLLAVLKGYPPMTAAEAGLWGATICTYGYSQRGGPKT